MWPWATRNEIDEVVWAAIALREGSMATDLTRTTGYSSHRVDSALRRLARANRVNAETIELGPIDGRVRAYVWFALLPEDEWGGG